MNESSSGHAAVIPVIQTSPRVVVSHQSSIIVLNLAWGGLSGCISNSDQHILCSAIAAILYASVQSIPFHAHDVS